MVFQYRVYVDGQYVGSAATKQLAQALLWEIGEGLRPGAKMSFQLKLGERIVGEGELESETLK